MPPLRNPRHEASVRLLLEGKSEVDAHQRAGYARDRGNATHITSSMIWLDALQFGSALPFDSTASSAAFRAIHFNSSTIYRDGIVWISQAPVAGVRLISTAGSSGLLTLTLIQGEGW